MTEPNGQTPEPLMRFHGAVYQTPDGDYVLAFRTDHMPDDADPIRHVIPGKLAQAAMTGAGPFAMIKAMMSHG